MSKKIKSPELLSGPELKNQDVNSILSQTEDLLKQVFAQTEKSNNRNRAEELVDLVHKEGITLFQDQYGEPYARIKVNGNYEIRKIMSSQFGRWVKKIFWEKKEKVLSKESLNNAFVIFEAQACYDGSQHNLSLRVAWHQEALWYDLGNGRAVKLTPGRWEVVQEPPILFRPYRYQIPQVMPIPCSVNELFKHKLLFLFLNIKNDRQKLLFLTNLIAGFIPDIPHPIDVFYGEQGTSKTTMLKLKKELLDPCSLKTITYHGNKGEFIQQASHHWYLPIDNQSVLPEWLSDTLCRVVTGEGFSKRQLYTDDDDVVYSFKSCLGLNGINVVPTKADLLDRCLLFELEPIDPNKVKSEKEFWSNFERVKPIIMGAIFTLLSIAMREYPSIKLAEKPRMADFATWGCAIAEALGLGQQAFIDAYNDNIRGQNEEAIESHPVASAIICFMDTKDSWEGSPTELYRKLSDIATNNGLDIKAEKWPKAANVLGRRINEVKSNLRKLRIIITRDNSNHSKGRKISLKKI